MPGAIKTEKNERNERHMQTNETTPMKGEQGVNLADVFLYLASKWKWFLLSVAVLGGLSWYHWAKSPLVYYRSATVIIKDPSSKTSTAGLDRFDNFINKVNVANEILQFRSKRLMREVVTRLHADVSYTVQDGLRRTELYTSSPVAVRFPDASPEQSLGLTVTVKDKGHVQLGGFQGFGPSAEGRSLTVRLGDTVSVSAGLRVVVTATNDYGTGWQGRPVEVRKSPLDAVADRYRNSIGIQQEEEESSILTLSVKDNSAARAEDVLNMLITVYNEEAIKDKNQVAVNTADFINERLIIISRELGGVETELEDFKRTNLVVDLGATTFWEDFDVARAENAFRIDEMPVVGKKDVHGDYGKECYVGFRHSLCHGWSAGVIPFLTETVLGIGVEKAGCAEVSVRAELGDLKYAAGTFPTPRGNIEVRHARRANGSVETHIKAPEGVIVRQEQGR